MADTLALLLTRPQLLAMTIIQGVRTLPAFGFGS